MIKRPKRGAMEIKASRKTCPAAVPKGEKIFEKKPVFTALLSIIAAAVFREDSFTTVLEPVESTIFLITIA